MEEVQTYKVWVRTTADPPVDDDTEQPTAPLSLQEILLYCSGDSHITHLYVDGGRVPPLSLVAPQLEWLQLWKIEDPEEVISR